ncbi:alpha/beta fold hydrolase [Nocardia sp. SYP-A9097]|uniref:alpha/beta fold hydrolase n=1 Tax=Nocardia sp. SYP-A9097 TaxID=2663237 RepID=UPI00129B28B3|nr:alpha/beta hydrolase [Nocardia sp. SYP-A9097]MRH87452.1 alpha/beta fold hydrolase [Nocardia sp. SYP-A9097]
MTNNSNGFAARIAPAVGGFRVVQGRRVFVHRVGSGGPAVVFLPGASAVGLDYLVVQEQVSLFTTAVVYDRGGTGYSDAVALPRSAEAVAVELRELLRLENIDGPYVLAAHSLGGLYAHRFAQLFPGDVAGLIWLDGLHQDWDEFMPAAVSLAAAEQAAPDGEEFEQLRPGLREMHAELLADYPEWMREPLIEAKVSDEWIRSGFAERRRLAEIADELRAGPRIPDVPVVALSVLGSDPTSRALMSQEMRDGRTRMDAALVSGFSRGEQRIVHDTLHHRLCFDRPDAVVQAIRDVVDRAARPWTRRDRR